MLVLSEVFTPPNGRWEHHGDRWVLIGIRPLRGNDVPRWPFLDEVLSGEVVLLEPALDPVNSIREMIKMPVWQGDFY